MLLTREEMHFDFGGHKLHPERDKAILRWMMSQFLYGEMTGIQVGQWLYDAPDIESARFLARQALEELQHVGNFLDIMGALGIQPERPNAAVRFLATGMMGESWAEHVAMEMALGEGFVLMAFYATIETLDAPEAVAILERAVRQEERHVDFGEQQTMKLITADPGLRRRLLGLSLVWTWGVRRIAGYIERRLPREHPVLSQLPAFLAHCLACSELRIQRVGLVDGPLSELSSATRARLVTEAYGMKLASGAGKLPLRVLPFLDRKKRLTDTYLNDPAVRALAER